MKNAAYLLFLLGLSISVLLTGCANNIFSHSPQPASQPDQNAYVALAEAATSVSQTLTQLAQTEQDAYPPVTVAEPPNPSSYGMAEQVSISYTGPVQPLVERLAALSNYQFNVTGTAPAIPVIVSIQAQDTPVANILRDAGFQCGQAASVIIYPSTKTVELRYAANQ